MLQSSIAKETKQNGRLNIDQMTLNLFSVTLCNV